MLSPLSVALAISSDGGGSAAITFMSGSGSTMVGSCPGCQRSMPLSEPPSEELPKNRLAVFTLKPSCDGWDAAFTSSSGWASSDIEISYCASGGALRAACNSGSSGVRPADGAAAVFAPMTELFDVAGSSSGGDFPAGTALSDDGTD